MLDIQLFNKRPKFEKIAVTIKLPDDPSKWAPQVLSELHRQSPIMKNFHSEIILDRTDPNKGAGFGYVLAMPKTADPLAAQGVTKIKIPIFIKNWHLSPIDIFFSASGKGYYLNERRIKEVLSRPDVVNGGVKKEDNVSSDIRTMLTPPWENVGQFYRGVNSQVSQSGQIKTSSLLRNINGTVTKKDIVKLASWVRGKEGSSSLWGRNELAPVFKRALTLESNDSSFNYEKIAEAKTAPGVQYRWDGGPVVEVKIAHSDSFDPFIEKIAVEQATQQMSQEQQAQLASQGQATQTEGMEVMSPEEMDGDNFVVTNSFGIHKVITVNNEQLIGWVFPFVLSFKMEKYPMQLFTDGSNFTTQSQIAGVHITTNANLPNEKPQGRGFFYLIKNGRAFAFAPIEIQGEQQQPDGNVMFIANTLLGNNQVQLMKVDQMQSAAEMGDNQFAIPGDVRWCSFKQQTNNLIEEPQLATQRAGAYTLSKMQQKAMMQQQAAMQQAAGGKGKKGQEKKANLSDRLYEYNQKRLTKTAGYSPIFAIIRATQDNTYTLSGRAFEKLARKHTHFLDQADTEWMLSLAGIEPSYTQEKLASIHYKHGSRVVIPALRELSPPKYLQVKTASLEKVSHALRKFMAKHAAEIKDPQIADNLLALNFLNPRNITMFIDYIPNFEMTSSQLANLLVAARLGESSINESAVKECLRNMEDVLLGLKMLAMTRETV